MVLKIYSTTKKFPFEERYGLTSQLRRAGYSIPMNLIEGGARHGEGEFRQFVNIVIGSGAEVEYQLELCHGLGYLTDDEFTELTAGYTSIGKMLNNLIEKITVNKLISCWCFASGIQPLAICIWRSATGIWILKFYLQALKVNSQRPIARCQQPKLRK